MVSKYSHLLSPIQVGSKVFRNRMVSAPAGMHMNRGSEAYPTDTLMAYYEGKARNGAAMIVINGPTMEYDTQAEIMPFDYDIRHLHNRMPLASLVDGIHLYGSMAFVNMHFSMPYGYDISAGLPIMRFGPPPVGADPDQRFTKEAPIEMLEQAAEEYSDLMLLLKTDCGFDGAHMYMPYHQLTLAQALSPLSNTRKDKYGGSLEKMFAYPKYVADLIKKKCGKDFILDASISFCDPFEERGGLTTSDVAEYVKMGVGTFDMFTLKAPYKDPAHPVQFSEDPTPWLKYAAEVKEKSGSVLPIATVGGFTTPALAESALAEGKIDIVSMARAWISNPNFVQLMSENRDDDIIPCLRCNKCHRTSDSDPYVPACSVNPTYGIEHKLPRLVQNTNEVKKIAIVGGGPAGMRTAILLADRGHNVTLFEEKSELGGLLQVTRNVSFKWTLQNYKDWLIHQVEKKNVDVHLNTKATKDILTAGQYDKVIICVGSEPAVPLIPGVEQSHVITAIESYLHPENVKDNIVIIGGGEIGMETAIYFARTGKKVSVLEQKQSMAMDAPPLHYRSQLVDEWEKYKNIITVNHATASSIDPEGVIYTDIDGNAQKIICDTVILAAGMKPKQAEAMALFVDGVRCQMIGDCVMPSNIQKINRVAYGIASSV